MAPALAQQQNDASSQTLAQERAAGPGVPFYVSPADVRLIQQGLNEAGYEAVAVDGQLGDGTISAICNFQQARGLEPTGALNPQTIQVLGVSALLGGGSSGQGGDQQLAQEASLGSGAPLFVSPATLRLIEQSLNDAGYDAGNIDGRVDDAFNRSLANYQQAQGLEPTGTVDLRTISNLGVPFGSGAAGSSGDQQITQETSIVAPGDCVSAGRASMAQAQGGAGGQGDTGGQGGAGAVATADGGAGTGGANVEETGSLSADAGGGDAAAGGTAPDSGQTASTAEADGGAATALEGGSGTATAAAGQASPAAGQTASAAGGQGQSTTQSQGGAQLFLSPASVRQIEQALNSAGYDAGSVDGLWDEGLRTAPANYQQAHGLEPTGNLDTRVVAALGGSSILQGPAGGGGGAFGTGGGSGGGSQPQLQQP